MWTKSIPLWEGVRKRQTNHRSSTGDLIWPRLVSNTLNVRHPCSSVVRSVSPELSSNQTSSPVCNTSSSTFGIDLYHIRKEQYLTMKYLHTDLMINEHPFLIISLRTDWRYVLPGRRTIKIPANFAASNIGWRALQSLKSRIPGAGFTVPPMVQLSNKKRMKEESWRTMEVHAVNQSRWSVNLCDDANHNRWCPVPNAIQPSCNHLLKDIEPEVWNR